MGSPIQITSQDTIAETNAAAAYNPDDDHYLLVWEHSGNTIYGRGMTGAGVVSTTETIAIASTAVTEEKPDVVYLNDQTGYVVVWSVSTGASREVNGRVVTADGVTGTTYQVSSGAQGDKLPRLDVDGEGGATVTLPSWSTAANPACRLAFPTRSRRLPGLRRTLPCSNATWPGSPRTARAIAALTSTTSRSPVTSWASI